MIHVSSQHRIRFYRSTAWFFFIPYFDWVLFPCFSLLGRVPFSSMLMSFLLPRQLLWDPQAAEAARHWNSNPQRCKFPAVHAKAHQVLQWHAKRPSSACWRWRWRPDHGNEQHFYRFVPACIAFRACVWVCAFNVLHSSLMLGFCHLHHAAVTMSYFLPRLPPACQEGEMRSFVIVILNFF